MKSVFFLSILVLSVPSLFVAVDAEEPLEYRLIFLHSFGDCLKTHYKSLQYYETITDQYLDKYDIPHSAYESLCISKDDLQTTIDNLPEHDLIIVIPDLFKGLEWAFNLNKLGHYIYNGNEHIIVSPSLSWKQESKSSAWTLSHELSHFALKYKNYPPEIFVGHVHDVESQYRECEKNDFTLLGCTNLWTTVTSPSGKSIPVMAIYTKPPEINGEPENQQEKSYDKCSERSCVNSKLESVLNLTIDDTTNTPYQEGDSICLTVRLTNPSSVSPTQFYLMGPKHIWIEKESISPKGLETINREVWTVLTDSNGVASFCDTVSMKNSPGTIMFSYMAQHVEDDDSTSAKSEPIVIMATKSRNEVAPTDSDIYEQPESPVIEITPPNALSSQQISTFSGKISNREITLDRLTSLHQEYDGEITSTTVDDYQAKEHVQKATKIQDKIGNKLNEVKDKLNFAKETLEWATDPKNELLIVDGHVVNTLTETFEELDSKIAEINSDFRIISEELKSAQLAQKVSESNYQATVDFGIGKINIDSAYAKEGDELVFVGKVSDNKGGIPNKTVRFYEKTTDKFFAATRTDDDGNFSFKWKAGTIGNSNNKEYKIRAIAYDRNDDTVNSYFMYVNVKSTPTQTYKSQTLEQPEQKNDKFCFLFWCL